MKKIIYTLLLLIITGCTPIRDITINSAEIKSISETSYYYEGDNVSFKIDSITKVYDLPTIPMYTNWTPAYYRGVHLDDSVNISSYYITIEKEKRMYIFSVTTIQKDNLKIFKFLIN